jgi:hypothetical protein
MGRWKKGESGNPNGRPPRIELLVGEKQEGETRRAVQACNDYLRMGSGRSLAKLLDRYQTATELPPTKRLKTLKDWSRKHNWQGRVSEYDIELECQKNEYRHEVIQSGLALDYERVNELKRLGCFLIDQVYEQDEDGRHFNVWLRDVKQIGGGLHAKEVKLERFNAAIISELRGVLDDLAKETGGRRQNVDVTSGDEPLQGGGGVVIILPSNGREIDNQAPTGAAD